MSTNFIIPKMAQRVVIDGWDFDRAMDEAQTQTPGDLRQVLSSELAARTADALIRRAACPIRGSAMSQVATTQSPARRRLAPTGRLPSSASSPMRWSLPVVLLILGLVAYPFFYAIYVSFTDQVVGNVGNWIGFDELRVSARTRRPSAAPIWNTIIIVLVSDVLKLVIGLGLALLVHQNLPARGIFRSFLMLPWAMPAFVAFLTWRVLYQPIGGGINLILTETGIYPHVVDWLGQRSTAMGSVIAASVWRGFPFWFVSHPRRAAIGARTSSTRRRASTAPMPGSASGR